MAGDGDEKRRKRIQLLGDPKLLEAVRGVIRMRGVPAFDVDDVLHQVIEECIENPNVPVDDPEQTRLFVCAAARNRSIDRARSRKKERERRAEVSPRTESPGPRLEDVVLARRLRDKAKELFPRTHSWFLRHELHGESVKSIAEDVKRAPGTVSSELFNIRTALRALGVMVAALFLFVFGWRQWRTPGGQFIDRHDTLSSSASAPALSPPPPPPSVVPTQEPSAEEPPPSAMALRQRARREFDEGKWDEALADLQAARNLDPAGDTPEWQKLEKKSVQKLQSLEAKP